jgi:hypothetical protein
MFITETLLPLRKEAIAGAIHDTVARYCLIPEPGY